ncbi:BolA family protein [Teredinibacter franksiae]|jgi:Predicted transcriptional regulator, BolA superfamily|uniref:BolA family protein n=1 Tax=Teredinibacter franksiae TaxID=2761453 RepID=UPI001628E603|nr:BolA/IbaG family iron-sulfur metabolism protein [Teredinibacter franksiae]
MQPEELKAILESSIDGASVEQISSDGRHVSVIIVSPAFENLNRVKRHQLVYSVPALESAIASDRLHALQMKTYSPAEWAEQNA